jgi:MFS transporter, SP family, arabinose:H+ symporter
MMSLTPETPRWLLLTKGDEKTARDILAISGENDIDQAVNDIKKSVSIEATAEKLFTSKFSKPLILAFLFAFFNQASGINAIIYFAPRIFEMTGLGSDSALLSTAGIGVVNMVFTVFGWVLIDRFGRKVLMYIGSIGYIVSLALIAMAFFDTSYANVPLFIFAFIASHAIGQGSVIWVFISEIFPNSVRASGMAWGCLTHWVFAAILTNVFPVMAKAYGGGPIFMFFSIMMVFQLIYVWLMMPETKGISLEDLQKKLIK